MKTTNSFSARHPTPDTRHPVVKWLDRAIVAWLFVMAASLPHSIAATQIAWMCGMLLWAARLVLRPRFYRTPVDLALFGFMLLTFVTAFTSYAPAISIGKLRAASLFTIVYLVSQNINTRCLLRLLALTLVASCMVNVVYTMAERAIGRGIRIEGITANSPLAAATFRGAGGAIARGVQTGDILLEVDGRKLRSPEALVAALEEARNDNAPARVKLYRAEWLGVYEVPRGSLAGGQTAAERLGLTGWARGRDWRAAGFFGHYVTYSEVLQLIASLAFGLFVALPYKRSLAGGLLLAAFFGCGLALLLTVTRASQLGLLISAFVIALAGIRSRRALLIMAACALPLVLAGLFLLQQKRQVGFFDRSDGSISWRETVWREGAELLVSNPRHLLVGVGMDSLKLYWREWGLFDEGRLPMGHMHSTPLQFALERGIPALLAWFVLLYFYARTLRQVAREGAAREFEGDWAVRGIALGALGGLAGFFASGFVHYNFGDSEVVMVFYFIMGLSLAAERLLRPSHKEAA